jgi:uncharacterized protein (TIGR00297 family)
MIPLAVIFNFPILIIILRKNYLTFPNGVAAAAGLGIVFFVVQPFFWFALLSFFFSSTILTKMNVKEKTSLNLDFEKGSTKRDAMQVIANGIVPLLFVISYAITEIIPNIIKTSLIPHNPLNPFFIGVFVAFAVHNADTWATEIGILSKRTPRLITRLKEKVPPGTSGGVTLDGIIASILGSLLLGFVFVGAVMIFNPLSITSVNVIIALSLIVIGGLAGSIIDSIEGATIQGIYYCNYCNKETESNPHPRCLKTTTLYRGNKRINNDFVNLSSALLIASCIVFLIFIIY